MRVDQQIDPHLLVDPRVRDRLYPTVYCYICVLMLLYTAVYVLALQALGVLRQIDPRVRDLILAVKIWAQRRGINEAFKGSLNSFYYLNTRLLLML
jgi:hypothetical protein